MQNPVGYKYDCMSYMFLDPLATCTRDIKDDMADIGDFFKDATNYYEGISMGFDMEASDFTNFDFSFMIFGEFTMSVQTNVGFIGIGTLNIDLYDQADLFDSQNIRPGFTAATFLQ